MAKLNKNSSVLAHDLLWRVLEEMQKDNGPEELAIDQDEMIDLPWEDQQFRTGEEDPPWCYEDNGFNGYQSVQEYRIHCPYRTMAFRNILRAGREFSRVMLPDSHYYMWTTKDFLLEALIALRMRGYQFKNMLVWIKTGQSGRPTYGMGHWYRNGVEFMLFGTKGQPGRPAFATTQPNYFFAPKPPKILLPNGQISKHSRKPQEAYDLICRNSPGPRVSLFQRGTRPGFFCWGDEAIEGMVEEWKGEPAAEVDQDLSFGVDWDAGLVDMVVNSEEVMALRTMLDMFVEQMDEVPDEVLGVKGKMDRIGQVLEMVEEQNREELLRIGLMTDRVEVSEDLRAEPELETESEPDPEPESESEPETTSDSKATPLVPLVVEVPLAEVSEENLAEVFPPLSELAHPQPEQPDPQPEAILHRVYKEDKKWYYDWDASELKVGPFYTKKAADEAFDKRKIRSLGVASDEEMDGWFAELQQKYPKLDTAQVMRLLLGEVERGERVSRA